MRQQWCDCCRSICFSLPAPVCGMTPCSCCLVSTVGSSFRHACTYRPLQLFRPYAAYDLSSNTFAHSQHTVLLSFLQAAFMGIDMIMDAKVQAVRKAEQTANNSSNKAPPADKSMYQVYSQYLAENKKDWQPGQLEATNALTCIGIQVGYRSQGLTVDVEQRMTG